MSKLLRQIIIDNQLVIKEHAKIIAKMLVFPIVLPHLCPPKKWEHFNRWDSADFTKTKES